MATSWTRLSDAMTQNTKSSFNIEFPRKPPRPCRSGSTELAEVLALPTLGYSFLSLLHPIKRLLQNLEIARVIELGTSGLNPLSFQRVFGRTINLVKHPKEPRER